MMGVKITRGGDTALQDELNLTTTQVCFSVNVIPRRRRVSHLALYRPSLSRSFPAQ